MKTEEMKSVCLCVFVNKVIWSCLARHCNHCDPFLWEEKAGSVGSFFVFLVQLLGKCMWRRRDRRLKWEDDELAVCVHVCVCVCVCPTLTVTVGIQTESQQWSRQWHRDSSESSVWLVFTGAVKTFSFRTGSDAHSSANLGRTHTHTHRHKITQQRFIKCLH